MQTAMSNVIRLKELIEICQEFGLEESKWIRNGLYKLSVRWDERLYKHLLRRVIHNNPIPLLNTTFPVPMNKADLEAVNGQYKIGKIAHTSMGFGLTPLQLQMHGIVGGGSGYGKSTLIKILCQQLLQEGKIKVWLIDPKENGDYRFLSQQFPDVFILRPDVLRCNPFNPIHNVPQKMLMETVTEVTADSFGVYDASEGLIAKQVKTIFEQHNRPCIADLSASLKKETAKFGGRRQGYLDSIESRLTKTQISLGEIIGYREDYFSGLYERSVVFEVGELSGTAQRFLVPWLIMKLVLYKIKNPTRHLSHLLIFDEAQAQIWSKNLEMRDRQSYMATLATQVRAFGMGILVLAQNPALKLMSEIIANSCVKICFHLGSGNEIMAMARHMGLNAEQMETLYHLERGQAICRTGLGYTEPVLLDIDNFEEVPVSDAELKVMMKPHWDLLLEKVVPVEFEPQPQTTTAKAEKSQQARETDRSARKSETTREDLDGSTEDSKNAQASSKDSGRSSQRSEASSKTSASKTDSDLSPDEQAYLRIVRTHPFRLITEIYALLNDEAVMGTERISQSRAVKIRQKLLKIKHIESLTVLGTGKSGRPQCDVPTDKAGGTPPKPRGGLLHAFWCYRVSEYFKQKGARVTIGDTGNGNEVDIDITLGEKRIGVEVVITTLIIENVVKHLSTNYHDETLILCVDEKKRGELETQIERIGEQLKGKIKVELLKEYFITL